MCIRDSAYTGFSAGYGTFRYLKKEDLDNWELEFEAVLDFALNNIRSNFISFRDHLELIHDEQLDIEYYELSDLSELESSIVLLPEFPSLVREIVGEEFLIGLPSRDYR